MRILRTVVEISMLTMFDPRQDLALGGPIALQFIGDDDARHVGQPLEKLAKELLCGLLVPPALHQDIQHVPLLLNCPPQIVMFALDGQKHLIEVPFIAEPGTAATELIRILLAELAAPFADRLIGHYDSTFKQQLFDIAEAEAKPKVQPHRVADDFRRKAVVLIVVGGWWHVHAWIKSHQAEALQGRQQVDNAIRKALSEIQHDEASEIGDPVTYFMQQMSQIARHAIPPELSRQEPW